MMALSWLPSSSGCNWRLAGRNAGRKKELWERKREQIGKGGKELEEKIKRLRRSSAMMEEEKGRGADSEKHGLLSLAYNFIQVFNVSGAFFLALSTQTACSG